MLQLEILIKDFIAICTHTWYRYFGVLARFPQSVKKTKKDINTTHINNNIKEKSNIHQNYKLKMKLKGKVVLLSSILLVVHCVCVCAGVCEIEGRQ